MLQAASYLLKNLTSKVKVNLQAILPKCLWRVKDTNSMFNLF